MLFDVGHQGGIDYLVMELLEGETLAHRIENGRHCGSVVSRGEMAERFKAAVSKTA
jgi:hypothetical protein